MKTAFVVAQTPQGAHVALCSDNLTSTLTQTNNHSLHISTDNDMTLDLINILSGVGCTDNLTSTLT